MILVTGSTGMVGSHLIFDLLNQGYQVKALVRKSSDKSSILRVFKLYSQEPEKLFDQIIWTEGDVTDILSLEEAFTNIEQVYHTAALVSFNSKKKKEILETNIDGTANIVNLCLEKNIKKLCFVSSIAALGVTEDGSEIDEKVYWKPSKNSSPYSISKYKAEMEVWRGITEGLNAIIVNPSFILGPANSRNGSSSLYNLVSKGLPFYTTGTTGYIDVRDVTKSMVLLMNSQIFSERFILSSENISYKSIFEIIANVMQVKPPTIIMPRWLAETAGRMAYVTSILFPGGTEITKSSINIAYKKLRYSSEKVKSVINIDFKPVREAINEFASIQKKRH